MKIAHKMYWITECLRFQLDRVNHITFTKPPVVTWQVCDDSKPRGWCLVISNILCLQELEGSWPITNAFFFKPTVFFLLHKRFYVRITNKFVHIHKWGPMSMVLLNLTLLEQGWCALGRVELRNESDGLAAKPFHASCGFFWAEFVWLSSI